MQTRNIAILLYILLLLMLLAGCGAAPTAEEQKLPAEPTQEVEDTRIDISNIDTRHKYYSPNTYTEDGITVLEENKEELQGILKDMEKLLNSKKTVQECLDIIGIKTIELLNENPNWHYNFLGQSLNNNDIELLDNALEEYREGLKATEDTTDNNPTDIKPTQDKVQNQPQNQQSQPQNPQPQPQNPQQTTQPSNNTTNPYDASAEDLMPSREERDRIKLESEQMAKSMGYNSYLEYLDDTLELGGSPEK